MLFTGEYEHSIDAKHRLAIPADIRSRLDPQMHGDGFYVAPGPNGALWLWPQRTFEDMAASLSQTPIPDEELMEYEEVLFSQAARLDLDSAGRIRLPERLILRYGLSGRVTIIGVRDHLELRDAGQWPAELDRKLDKHSEIVLRARRAIKQDRSGGKNDGP